MATKPTILLTGGHLTPALAMIEELHSRFHLVFVGRVSTDIYGSHSKEQELVTAHKIRFVPFKAPKLHRKPLYKNVPELSLYLLALPNAIKILKQNQIDLVLSFGGYLSLPIGVAARVLGIPVVTHEQTTVVGLSNHILSFLGAKLAVSWPELVEKTRVLTGNPVRLEFTCPQPKPDWVENPNNKPILVVTGGNQGALDINKYISDNLELFVTNYYLVHQTGSARKKADYQYAQNKRQLLSPRLQPDYQPRTWLSGSETAWLFANAKLVVGRSGANTITELLVTKTPSVLIPLPVSGGGEQDRNAKLMAELGLSQVLVQDSISSLPEMLAQVSGRSSAKNEQVSQLQQLHLNATTNLASLIDQELN